MNDHSINEQSDFRQKSHKTIRYISMATVYGGIVGFFLSLVLYAFLTIACGGEMTLGNLFCEYYEPIPIIGFLLFSALYIWIIYILLQLGREEDSNFNGSEKFQYNWDYSKVHALKAWTHTKKGYKDLNPKHHRLVRHIHRIASLSLSCIAVFISFWILRVDNALINIIIGIVVYLILGELLNWKRYSKLIQK